MKPRVDGDVGTAQLKRRFRFLWFATGAGGALVLAAGIVATRPAFHTWIVQRALVGQPELGLTVGHVELGWRRHEVRSVVWRGEAGRLEAPRLTGEFPLWAAWREGRLDLTRLEAEGFTFFAGQAERKPESVAAPVPAGTAGAPTALSPAPPAAVGLPVLAGLLNEVRLPFDASVEFLRLSGKVVLPESRGTANVSLTGGGLAAGKEGKFDLIVRADFRRGEVERLEGTGVVTAVLETPRTFQRLAIELRGAAAGPRIGADVVFTAGLTAGREAAGEAVSGWLARQGHRVLVVEGELPGGSTEWRGRWQIDADDRDLAPLALGSVWPGFALKGAGTFAATATGKEVQLSGQVAGPWSRLEAIRPELAALGEVRTQVAFEAVEGEGRLLLRRLEAEIGQGRAAVSVSVRQPVAIDPGNGAVVAADLGQPVARLAATAVPVAWIAPWVRAVTVTGGEGTGEAMVFPLADGVSVRTVGPFRFDRLSFANGTDAKVTDVALSTEVAADVTARGWQVELNGLRAALAGKEAARGDSRIGRLAGAEQPVKLEGRMQVDAAAWARQPWVGGRSGVEAGEVNIEYAASLGATTEFRAKAGLSGGRARRQGATVLLPTIAADLKADFDPAGAMTLELPLVLEQDGRRSDFAVRGRVGAPGAGPRRFELQVTGESLHLADVTVLGAVRAADDGKPEVPWQGLEGSLQLQLKKVVTPDATEFTGVEGNLRLENEELVLETGRLGWTNGARATAEGRLAVGDAASGALHWSGAVAVQDFDPAEDLKRAESRGEPTVEGRFDLAAKVSGRAATWSALGRDFGGEFTLASRGGIFRGLPLSAGNVTDGTGTLAALLASAGNMIGGIAGRRENVDIANRSQAVGELAKRISALEYDQLSAKGRLAADRIRFEEVVVTAPEVRLSGQGTMAASPTVNWWNETIGFEYRLRARGRTGELLRYLGLLETTRDELGYVAGALDLEVGGTMAAVDAEEASRKLVAAAFAKAGFIDKAADWLARTRAGRSWRGTDGGGESGK